MNMLVHNYISFYYFGIIFFFIEKSESLYKYITTMICIAVKDKPLIGIIHKPFEKITSWAWVGEDMSEDLKQKKVEFLTIILIQK